ncbi:outer membrane beta-barrel protein [Flavobacterium aquidurense]|uniref:outer membrane beta-barrel protein n=1 Tax=Flavobacterium TaxID=237 RepID=UPI00375722D1
MKLDNNYVKFDFEIRLQKHNFSVSIDGKYNSIKANKSGAFNANNELKKINFDYKERNLALYASAHKKIDKLGLPAGVRFGDFSINMVNNTLTSPIKFNIQLLSQ